MVVLSLKINDLIFGAEGDKYQILLRLKTLNKKAYDFMMQPYKTFQVKYKQIQKSIFWHEARGLLLKYFKNSPCRICGEIISYDCQLHHKGDGIKQYIVQELFSPCFVEFLHSRCHTKVHDIE